MNTSRKAMEWLTCFSVVNLMLDAYYLKSLKNLVNLVPCQKQLECHQHILKNVNICVGFYGSKCLNEYNLNRPKIYLRYVDNFLNAFDKEQDSLNFLNKRHPNIKFTTEKQINHSIAFPDVFISGINNQNLTLQTYQKFTYTGLLLNFKSFASFSYKISLNKGLVDRSFKVCNNWNSFHNDIEGIKSNLIKNAHLPF